MALCVHEPACPECFYVAGCFLEKGLRPYHLWRRCMPPQDASIGGSRGCLTAALSQCLASVSFRLPSHPDPGTHAFYESLRKWRVRYAWLMGVVMSLSEFFCDTEGQPVRDYHPVLSVCTPFPGRLAVRRDREPP